MTPERWRQIEEVYHAALEREPEGRPAYLSQACRGDETLQKEVESLLERDDSAPDALLNSPVWRAGELLNSEVTSLAPGSRLGPYELENRLGAGGMGEVWKARDTRLGRLVAVKVSKTGFSQRFEREARAVAALNHPHICTLYDVGPNYFVMEYVDGKPLQQLIPRKGLPLPQVLSYAEQIADALAAAHASSIVHRDLKPGNIMVALPAGERFGCVKVVDFGLARVPGSKAQGADDSTRTESSEGVIAGTFSYMSPEQAQGHGVDARSDVFSFGAVLYEMLTGVRAFPGGSPISILADVINKDPRPVGEVVFDMPHELEALLGRCLRKDPARRWQNMAEVKAALLDLREVSDSFRLNAAMPGVLRKRQINPIWAAAGAATLMLAAAAGWYFAPAQKPGNNTLSAVPLTSYPGTQLAPSFSPEGNQVAFVWNGPHSDNWDIYVKVVGEGEPLRLTSDPADEVSPAWSPDGRWIAFARILPDRRYVLMLISPLGGVPQKLGEFGSPRTAADPAFSWSPDSRHLVFPVTEEPTHRNGLFLLSLDSRDIRQLTSLDRDAPGDTQPAVSPDGRMVAYTRFRDSSLGDLYTLNLANDLTPRGPPRLLAPAIMTNAAWTADGKELLYSSGPQGAETLKRIAISGTGTPQPVPLAVDGTYYPAISRPTGNVLSRLAWEHRFRNASIYRLELSGEPQKAGNLQAWIASSFRNAFPQYSPDGKSITFSSTRSGAAEIWICQTDGSTPRQLTSLGANNTSAPRWSPDGKQIAFSSNKEGANEFYVVSAEGGLPRRMTDPPSASFSPDWSGDGRWIYFTSNRGGAPNIWKMPAVGGQAEQVTHRGGMGPTVSPDARFLYYWKDRDGVDSSLWRVPLAGGEEMQMVARIYRGSYAVNERGLYYSVSQASDSAGTIEFLDPDTGQHAILARTDKRLAIGLSVSPDGRYLLYPRIDYEGGNLMMIENFR